MRTLLVRLSVSHLLVALGALALLLWLSPTLFVHFYLTAQEQRLASAAHGLARAAGRLSRLPAASDDLSVLVRTSAAMLGGDVALIARADDAVFMASSAGAAANDWAIEAYRSLDSGQGQEVTIRRGTENSLIMVSPIPDATAPVSAVAVRRRAGELAILLRAQRLMSAMAAALALVLAVALSVLLSRTVSQPLVGMYQAARTMASGDLQTRVPERGPVELASLARSLNDMAASLDEAFSALEAERQRLAGVLATMSEGVIGLDAAGRVQVANASARELVDSALEPGSSLDDTPLAGCLADHGDPPDAGGRSLTVGDRRLSCSVSAAADGGAVVVVADVTAQYRLEIMRRDFVASVSHELRAPLTSIQGFLGAIMDGTANDPEEQAHCVRVASREAGRMTRLVEELLTLSRLQAGVMEFDMQPTALPEVIRSVIQSYGTRAADAQVAIVGEFAADVPSVMADGDRLAQVLVNLIDNALRYSRPGGTITVSLVAEEAPAGPRVVAKIRDLGPGIPPGDLERVWDRFHKADPARSPSDSGAGLGLAIVREIVEAHHGEVFARNHPDGGAEIGFRLPLPG